MLDKNKFRGAVAGAGLTQCELAKRIGISKNTLSSKVNGKGCFDVKQIDLICKALGIDDMTERAHIFLSNPSQNGDDQAS